MPGESKKGADFIERAEAIVLDRISDESFGVSELAEAMHMSRSNLLRKIKKRTQLSASQFIREIRLGKSMELLRQGSLSVSEISYEVGFNSPSYFIKCFREHYGYPPGEASKRNFSETGAAPGFVRRHRWKWAALAITLIVLTVAGYFFKARPAPARGDLEKSIAVLPFKNDIPDSTNLHFINGLM